MGESVHDCDTNSQGKTTFGEQREGCRGRAQNIQRESNPSDGWSLYLQARKGLITYQCMIHGKRSVPGIELRDLLLDVQVLYQLSYIDLYFPIVHAPSRPISTYTRSSCRSTSTVHVCHSRIPSCWVGGPPQGGSVSGTAMTRTSKGLAYSKNTGVQRKSSENTAGIEPERRDWSLYLQIQRGIEPRATDGLCTSKLGKGS